METFSCTTKIISGHGAIRELRQLACHRLLVVAAPFFKDTDVPRRIQAAAGADSVAWFYEVKGEPSVELAAEGTALVQKFQPDTVVALGGGSVMDCAKAMIYFTGKAIPLVAIPTTSGSGSEVTDFSVLTHNGSKHPLVDKALLPAMAILDGDLLRSLPQSIIADAGFDIIAHALESYVATGAGAMSKAMARDAFITALQKLPASYRGDTAVRQDIHLAATMAGVAFSQSGLGLCHAMSHSLGGRFHIPHGRLNAILLPAVVEHNTAAYPAYAELARSAGLGGTADTIAVRNLRNALLRLRKELALPQTLAQAGVSAREVGEQTVGLVQAALEDPCCKTNPIPPTEMMVQRILSQVTGNG